MICIKRWYMHGVYNGNPKSTRTESYQWIRVVECELYLTLIHSTVVLIDPHSTRERADLDASNVARHHLQGIGVSISIHIINRE